MGKERETVREDGKRVGNCERMWEREVVDGKEGIRAEVAGDETAGG